jgi:MFS family permease
VNEPTLTPAAEPPVPGGWLNRTVLGAGLTSLLADACYETAIAVLPLYFVVLGKGSSEEVVGVAFAGAALWLGLMEGTADAVASSVKLGAGWLGDRLGHRKTIVTLGYLMTGVAGAFYALADVRAVVVLIRVVAWLGKGIRGPLRDAILADAVSPANRGKVFGFHRAGDTVGAVLGPLTAAVLLKLSPVPAGDPAQPFRFIFLLTLVPGLGAALAFVLMIREERQTPRTDRFWASVRALPVGFRRALVGIGVFGAGDFSAGLLVLAATWLLSLSPDYHADAWALGAALYTLRNVLYALASYPVGALSDRVGRRGLLAGGYVLGSMVIAGFAVMLWVQSGNLPLLAVLFGLAGVFAAFEDSLKGAITADLVPDKTIRGTAYGVMGTVSGLGDFVSSVGIGLLWWAFGPVPGFVAAAGLMIAGAGAVASGQWLVVREDP